jgi:glycosyltransferase involved in cell wall biosynthesis
METRHGISFSFVYPGYRFSEIFRFTITFLQVLFFRKRDSMIVFQKIYTNGIYAHALKFLLYFRRRNTLYDIDDAEYLRRPVTTLHHFMRSCSACSAGSEALVNYIRPFNPDVFLLTSPVMEHPFVRQSKSSPFTIGWIGYYGAHRASLMQLLFPALLHLHFPIALRILGAKNAAEVEELNTFFQLYPHITVDAPLNIDWQNEESVYALIRTFDAGVSPLLDSEFNRAKSAFKLKQCLSCGVPVLASSVGENLRFLEDGVNGFLCDSPAEYADTLTRFHDADPETYEAMSRAARSSLQGFSIRHYSEILLCFFQPEKR